MTTIIYDLTNVPMDKMEAKLREISTACIRHSGWNQEPGNDNDEEPEPTTQDLYDMFTENKRDTEAVERAHEHD